MRSNEEGSARRSSTARSGVDADQLQKVLKDFDDAGKAKDTTPGGVRRGSAKECMGTGMSTFF